MRLTELVENISRFDAIEEIVHEDQDPDGKELASTTREYDYVAQIITLPEGTPGAGVPVIDESRISPTGLSDILGGIRTKGLPTLAFVFHPAIRGSFEIACQGLGEWNGQPAWLVDFQQMENRPNYLQQYIVRKQRYSVPLKGRAWVDARTFQTIHMEAGLVHPIPEILLQTEQYSVDYGPVRFQRTNSELWLPKRAEMHFDFRGHRYYRRHSFDNFKLFSVDSTQKVTTPKTE